jgi:hypothetical protein
MIQIIGLNAPSYGACYDYMVRRFSTDSALIVQLRKEGVERLTAAGLIQGMANDLGVTPPAVTFHGRRGPHTGYCQMPRWRAVAQTEESTVTNWERAKRRDWPDAGMIRLGDPTSLGTMAHELGHHLVNLLDDAKTPAHGKVWVARFDLAAATLERLATVGSSA